MIAVVVIAASFCFFVMNRYVIRPKKTTAIVAWPDGKAKPSASVLVYWCNSILVGRGRWMISFRSFISIPVMIIVVAKRMDSFFCFFR